MKVKFKKKAVSLTDCPVGLFCMELTDEVYVACLKTEYGNNQGEIDAYNILTGEKLSVDEKTATKKGCDSIIVYPQNNAGYLC